MQVNDTNNDYALWQSLKKGDRTALEQIYFTCFKHLYEYGLRITDDNELVKDTIQDLFIKLWNNRANFDNVSNIKPYLLVSVRSALYNKLEQQKKEVLNRTARPAEAFDMIFSVESRYVEQESRSIQTRQLIEALNQLTPRQKEIIYLRYFEELDYSEIAKIMNSSQKSVYKLKSRGIDALKHILNASGTSLLLLFASCRANMFS